MTLALELQTAFDEQRSWAHRRQLGIANNRRLWVCACMDERLPVNEALGIREGDAHVFRNAGGLITDDAIRSAMLTCNFFGTEEIIIINHTECGMMSHPAETLVKQLSKKVDLDSVQLDPGLPELKLAAGAFGSWIRMFDDVDEICRKQVEYVRNHPLIPDEVTVSGWVWEVENRRLRPPGEQLSARVNTSKEMTVHRKGMVVPRSPAGGLVEE